MRRGGWVLAGAAILGAASAYAAASGPTLAEPVQIMAGSKPISVDVGHAAPCLADIDGDGQPELLVGQFGEGKLRIYKNEGTRTEPRFGSFTWFQAGGTTGKVPSG